MMVELTCSFCDRPQSEVRRLIAGPGLYICNDWSYPPRASSVGPSIPGCIALATDVVRRGAAAEDRRTVLSPAAVGAGCSFCGKSANEVPERAVDHTGATVVCTECVDLFHEILAEELAGPG